jgi:hypothetical protein
MTTTLSVRSRLRAVVTGGIVILAWFVTSTAVDAATITVNSFNEIDVGFCTIATAIASINAAADQGACTHSGTYGTSDTIVLAAGTYGLATANNGTNGYPIVLVAVTINGNGATLSRTVVGAPFFRFFEVDGGGLTLNNATLTGGSVPGGQGGAIFVNSGALPLTVSGSTFSTNSASAGQGGAIFNDATTAISISSSTFTNNTAGTGQGGAIFDNTTNGMTLSNSTFTGNSAGQGGAVFDDSTAGLTINSSTFTSNTAPLGQGGAIFDNSSNGLIFNTGNVTSNSVSSGEGGGIYDNSTGGIQITNVAFTGNTATGGIGGAIFDNSTVGTGPVSNNCFVGNTATSGGGIFRQVTTLNAINNWWGAASGPSGAGPGTGDAVNANVTFAPFLTSPAPGICTAGPAVEVPTLATPMKALLGLALALIAFLVLRRQA